MSDLEVLAAVTSIVSAFNNALSLYRSWRDQRSDRVADEENHQLEYSLYMGATTIQQEYERYSARLGPRFSSGDSDAKSQLTQYITYFHYALDNLSAESNFNGLQLPSLTNILAVSDATRVGVVGILEDQYERMTHVSGTSRAYLSNSHRSALRGSVASETQRDVVRRGAARH